MPFPNENDLIKPWSWNIAIEAVMWFVIILIVVAVITWTAAGKDRKNLPDQIGRNVEDFAGVTQEGNGPVPVFLLLLYAIIAIMAVGYPAITLLMNYNY